MKDYEYSMETALSKAGPDSKKEELIDQVTATAKLQRNAKRGRGRPFCILAALLWCVLDDTKINLYLIRETQESHWRF